MSGDVLSAMEGVCVGEVDVVVVMGEVGINFPDSSSLTFEEMEGDKIHASSSSSPATTAITSTAVGTTTSAAASSAAAAAAAALSAEEGHSTRGLMTLVGDAVRGVMDCGVALAGVALAGVTVAGELAGGEG